MSNSNNSNANTKNTKKAKGKRSAAAIERRKAKWATQRAAKKANSMAKQQEKKNEETRKQKAVLNMFPDIVSIVGAQGFMPNVKRSVLLSKTMKSAINTVPLFADADRATVYPGGKTILGKYIVEGKNSEAIATLNKGVSKAVLETHLPGAGYLLPLVYAYTYSKFELFKKLLERGADPNAIIITMIGYRKQNRIPFISSILADRQRRPDTKLPYLTELLKYKVDLNVYDAFNMSPLDVAFAEKDDEAAKLLIKKGADPNKPNSKGFTPFMTAISSRNRKIVKYLIDSELVDINKVTGEKILFPLKMATTSSSVDILSDIVEAGVDDINKQDNEGNTALHYATKANDMKKVKVLLKGGANTQVLNKKKETPFQIARALQEKGDARIYDLLKNA